jgi:competence ComEA-like helix-hairpin-helix protein
MPEESRSEKIRRRREAMAADDRQNRRWLLLIVVGFALAVAVLLVKRWIDSGPVDLNKAPIEKLETLPGIGPETAKAIIKGRPYKTIDDLGRVKGIGPATIEKIRERLNPDLELEGVLATMYDPRTLHSREVLERVVQAFGEVVFHSVIRRTVKFPETTVAGEPITTYAPNSPGAASYRSLAREVLQRCHAG